MVDVTRMPAGSFGSVPTPALVAPIEFTMRRQDYEALGGHMDHVMAIEDAVRGMTGRQNDHVLAGQRTVGQSADNPWPTEDEHYSWKGKDGREKGASVMTEHARLGPTARMLGDGRRLHLQQGPIDLIVFADGPRHVVEEAYARAAKIFAPVLQDLVDELTVLRQPTRLEDDGGVKGLVARRMVDATRAYRPVFITPMASVAGAVADHVLAAMVAVDGVSRASVNNGGDIALYLAPGAHFKVGIVAASGDGAAGRGRYDHFRQRGWRDCDQRLAGP